MNDDILKADLAMFKQEEVTILNEMRMRAQGILVRRLIPALNDVQTQIKHVEALIEVNNKKSKKVTKSVAPIKATNK